MTRRGLDYFFAAGVTESKLDDELQLLLVERSEKLLELGLSARALGRNLL